MTDKSRTYRFDRLTVKAAEPVEVARGQGHWGFGASQCS
jgi:hypothetical protein